MNLYSLEVLGPFLWRSTTVIAAGFVLNAVLFRRCPARCHATLVASLVLVPVIWLTAGVEWSMRASPEAPPSRVELEAVESPVVALAPVLVPNRLALASDQWNVPGRWLGENLREAGPPESESALSLGALLFVLWLAGALFLAVRQVIRWRALRSVLNRARWVLDPGLGECLRELQDRLGVRRRIHLLQAAGLPGPCAAGVFSPVILVPEDFGRTGEVEATLAHEVLHHRRHDLLFQFLGQWIRTLFWFQPLIHLACRAASIEREKAVDLAVVEALGKPDEYAELLVRSARRESRALFASSCPVAPLGAGASALRRRIEMLMSHTKFRNSRRPRLFAALIGFSFCLATLFLLMTGEGRAQPENREAVTFAVATGQPGRFRLHMGLDSVSLVEWKGAELSSEDWAYDAGEEVLEVRVPVEDPMKLKAFGKRTVPWVYNLERLYSENVTIKVGDRELEQGKEFTVDLETRTIRLKVDLDQGPLVRYSLTYETSPKIFTSLVHQVGQREAVPPRPADPEDLKRAHIVPTDRPGFYRLSWRLQDVAAVRLTRNALGVDTPAEPVLLKPDTDYSYSEGDALLELKVEVDPAKDLVTAYGEPVIPWIWTIANLVPDSVDITLGDRKAERGVDFSLDPATGTIRLLRASDCGENAKYRVNYAVESDLGLMYTGFGNLPPEERKPKEGDGSVYQPPRGPRGQGLDPTALWSTSDPRIFVPRRPVLQGAYKLTFGPKDARENQTEWNRGEDFLFDPVAQRLVLLQGRTIDLDTQSASLWADGIDPQLIQFPVRIDRSALRVTANGNLLEEGKDFEIVENDTCVKINPGVLDWSKGMEFELTMGAWQTSYGIARAGIITSSGDR